MYRDKIKSIKTKKKNKLTLIRIMVVLIIFAGLITYHNISIHHLKNMYSNQISELKKYNEFTMKDVESYKYLYDEVTESEKQLNRKYQTTNNELKTLKAKLAMSKNINSEISRGGYASKDLRSDYIMTEDQLNDWIKERAPKDSPFIGQAGVFIEASKESELDPRYIVAHAALESKWGTSNIARDKHNYFGINAQNANPNLAYHQGNSLESGIVEGAKWIKKHYIDKGQNSISKMLYGGPAYCQNSDGSPSQSWMDQIINIIYK